jgi:hypothetical protein
MSRMTKAKVRLMESRRAKWMYAGKPFMILCLDCNLECEQLREEVTTEYNLGNCPRQTGGILSGKGKSK